MAAIDKILKEAQIEALEEADLMDKQSVRAASDETLIKIQGIGPATIIKLREWSVTEVDDGDAISLRFLLLKNSGERLDVAPGDVIPARFGAARHVETGKARWH